MRIHKHKWIKVSPPKDSPFSEGSYFWVCKRCTPPRIEFKDPKKRRMNEKN